MKFCDCGDVDRDFQRSLIWRSLFVVPLAVFWGSCPAVAVAGPNTATGEQVIATVQPIATDAGIDAYHAGGNAVDAAVAAALMLGVVDQHNSGLGGGCFILIRRANGDLVAIDGRETAPAAATRDMYLRDGKARTEFSRHGPLAAGVPGALAAYDLAIKYFGNLSLTELIEPAADVAAEGFALDRVYARNLSQTADILAQFEGSRETLLNLNGQPQKEGEVLKQPDLARTYRAIARGGIDWFYRRTFAEQVAVWMADHGGIITMSDFATYRARFRQPVTSSYRGYTIVGFPPPSSGGVHVAQILNILEPFNLREIYKTNPNRFRHVVAEAMKLAFADRAHWLGDADFADVPRGLTRKDYARRLSGRINSDKVSPVTQHDTPPNTTTDLFGKHTTHIAAADDEGNWVAITATVNTSFGCKVIVPGTGIVLNNQMDDFSAQPGAPNAFGLIGAENNAIEPGKRPLSSMSPTIVLRDGQPVMTVGAAGGPKIITQVVLAITRHLDLGMSIDEAIARARFHHQWSPDRLFLEESFSGNDAASLAHFGHTIERREQMGVTQAIISDGNTFTAVNDPRVPGKARGLRRTSVDK